MTTKIFLSLSFHSMFTSTCEFCVVVVKSCSYFCNIGMHCGTHALCALEFDSPNPEGSKSVHWGILCSLKDESLNSAGSIGVHMHWGTLCALDGGEGG